MSDLIQFDPRYPGTAVFFLADDSDPTTEEPTGPGYWYWVFLVQHEETARLEAGGLVEGYDTTLCKGQFAIAVYRYHSSAAEPPSSDKTVWELVPEPLDAELGMQLYRGAYIALARSPQLRRLNIAEFLERILGPEPSDEPIDPEHDPRYS